MNFRGQCVTRGCCFPTIVVQEIPCPPLVAALETMVHLDFRPTPATALVAKLQFPLGYPQVRAGC